METKNPDYRELRRICIIGVLIVAIMVILQLMSKDIKNKLFGPQGQAPSTATKNYDVKSEPTTPNTKVETAPKTPEPPSTGPKVSLVKEITETDFNNFIESKSTGKNTSVITFKPGQIIVSATDDKNRAIVMVFVVAADKKSLELKSLSPDNIPDYQNQAKQGFSQFISSSLTALIKEAVGAETLESLEIQDKKLTLVYTQL